MDGIDGHNWNANVIEMVNIPNRESTEKLYRLKTVVFLIQQALAYSGLHGAYVHYRGYDANLFRAFGNCATMTEPSTPQVPVAPVAPDMPASGGSAAGQAFRAELARQGREAGSPVATETPAPPAAKPATPPASGEARAAERRKVNGRARVMVPGAEPVMGKMVDISLTGACVMLDGMFPSKKMCTLEYDIFHAGVRHVFVTPALSVYGVLASGKGFKVGFQFGPVNEAARKSLAVLVQ